MPASNYLFTSESVSEGHPDKMCDAISDAILDAHLEQDNQSRVACETMVKTGFVMVAGEVTSNATVNFDDIVREVVLDIGFDHTDKGFDGHTCAVQVALGSQSRDISQGVTEGEGKHDEQGAGDQGMMFGYAVNETENFMPMSIEYSHRLLEELAVIRKTNEVDWLRPDSKSQVTVEYRDGQPHRVHTVVISTQHSDSVSDANIEALIRDRLVPSVVPANLLDSNTIFHVNPTGRFVIGGPMGDCGLTGRKIIVDTYGGHGAHGGGAFSGKDPSKVDRSAAYVARYAAKNLVAAGAADRVLVQLAYAIGVAEPVSVMVDSYGTGKASDEKLATAVRELFPTKPASLIGHLDLLRPVFRPTAAYGHFGREGDSFTWEKIDRVDAVRDFLN